MQTSTELPHGSAHDQLAEEALRLLRDIARTARMARSDGWTDLDLTVPQLKVLMTLAHGGGAVTVGHMADVLGVRQPTASHLIERLVQAGLAARVEDQEDRRRTLVHITPTGEQLVGRLLGFTELLRRWIGALDEPDLLALRQGLGALFDIAQREAPETLACFQDKRL